MAKPITVSDVEPAHEWLNKLAREAEENRRFPQEYDTNDVRQLVTRVGEDTRSRQKELRNKTTLSDREAESAALKERGLTHQAIALVMSLSHRRPRADNNISPSTVDEYVRRGAEKYNMAVTTAAELNGIYETDDDRPDGYGERRHPEPPGDNEHWVPGDDGQMHLPGSNGGCLCGHHTGNQPKHYRNVSAFVDTIEWRKEAVCDDCLDEVTAGGGGEESSE